ncbi:hypothetical protein UM764_05930 [Staphylococcus aureus]|nr:hypothetical protein UM764_05930 [Staphylococcus aureus]WRN73184.1 hypothetical protein UM582_01490 [Staphylococcus aureus]
MYHHTIIEENDVWANQYEFPIAVIEEVLKAKEVYGNKDFIVGYRLSPEEAESPGITNGNYRGTR